MYETQRSCYDNKNKNKDKKRERQRQRELVYGLLDSGDVRDATELLRYVTYGHYDTWRSHYDT